jgi:hypothetical protein
MNLFLSVLFVSWDQVRSIDPAMTSSCSPSIVILSRLRRAEMSQSASII